MSDETTRTDDWATADASSPAPAGAQESAAKPAAFCQDCGRGLTAETRRTVGAGVFCEPCLETRLRQGPYGAPQGVGAAPGYGIPQPGMYGTVPAPIPGEPSPFLAALLGLIPGVGAMYNGQFAKGVMHLIVFVILVFMSNNVSGVFGLFVAGWIFYQAFEAYHTAVARRDGLPLPNPFGFNDIGERMGFGKSWGATGNGSVGTPPVPPPPTTPWAGSAPPEPPVPPAAGPDWVRYAPPTAGRDWVGYVPPTAFAGSPVPPAPRTGPVAQQAAAPWGHAPFVETYTGTGGVPSPASPAGYGAPPYGPVALGTQLPSPRRFPVGALWLIGLGLLILLANLVPNWRIAGRWWPPVLFAGLAVWLLTRRLVSGARIACIVRWPAILMVLAVLFALHAAYFVVTFGMTCAVLLIAFGALLLLERTLGAGSGPAAVGAFYGPPSAAYGASADPARATFTTPGTASSEPAPAEDAAKDGL